MLSSLHEESLEDEKFAPKVAMLFGCLSQMEVEGVKCRRIFLKKIQAEFETKEAEWREKKPVTSEHERDQHRGQRCGQHRGH